MWDVKGNSALVRVPTAMIDELIGLSIRRLIRNMEKDPVLALVVVVRDAKVNWEAFLDQNWFPYDYTQDTLMPRVEKGALVGQIAGEGECEAGSQSLIRPVCCAGHASRGIKVAFVCVTWRPYLANDVNYFYLPTLEERKGSTIPQWAVASASSGVRLVQSMMQKSQYLHLKRMRMGARWYHWLGHSEASRDEVVFPRFARALPR